MRLVATVLILGICQPAMAGTLRCSFTEPFFVIEFDSKTGVVTFISPDEADPDTGAIKPRVLAEGARVRRPGVWQDVPKLVLEAPGKGPGSPFEPLVEIAVTGAGSDGMSESVFPFEGRFATHVGGCETGKAQAYDAYEVYEDIGVVEDQP